MDYRTCIGNHRNSVIIIRVCNHAVHLLSRLLIIILLRIDLIRTERLHLSCCMIRPYVERIILHILLKLIRLKHYAHALKIFVIDRCIPRRLTQVHFNIIVNRRHHSSIDTALTKSYCLRIRRHYIQRRVSLGLLIRLLQKCLHIL